MTDFKSMYYHLAGRMAVSVEVMEATVSTLRAAIGTLTATANAFADVTERLKQAQQATEAMFMMNGDEDGDEAQHGQA